MPRKSQCRSVCHWAMVIFFAILLASGCTQPQDIAPPVARVEPKADTLFGDIRVDDYFWLRKRSDPRVLAYLEAENAYTEAYMRPTEKLQQRLFEEFKGRLVEADTSAPVKMGDYWYYNRFEEGAGYPVYCRRQDRPLAEEEILLDPNQLAEGRPYFEVWAFKPSPDQRLLAYSVDTTGAEIYTIYIKDLDGGRFLDETIEGTYGEVEWAGDNATLYYSTMDEILRPYRLYRHRLGTAQESDRLLLEEPDERYYLGLSKSRSQRYILVNLESEETTEVHVLDAHRPDAVPRVIWPRRQGVEYEVAHWEEWFFVRTNQKAENFRLVKVPVDRTAPEFAQEVIPQRSDVTLEGMDLFQHHLVVYERENGLRQIRIQDLRDGQVHRVGFPEPVYTFWPEENPEFRTSLLRFSYTSLVTPRTVYDYHMDDRTWDLKKYYRVGGGYDPSRYRTERIWAIAEDGISVPISLVCAAGLSAEEPHPLLLYGYGAYGISSEPRFSIFRLSLLDRGFIYARAHVRGGGEMGRQWYLDGKLLNKMNTFTDFIACGEHLIEKGYTSADRLVISGGSAGGLLIGAVLNMRPDLFAAAVAEVPFVDVLNTMLDPTIPLTVTEYEEWGNPHEKVFYDYMRQYSPYDNVRDRAYPALLITAGLNDPRVQYWEPAKWTAKLRALKTSDAPLLLKTDMGSGHMGQTSRYDELREVAFEYAFLLSVLDIDK
jgi:oligopeptidase B